MLPRCFPEARNDALHQGYKEVLDAYTRTAEIAIREEKSAKIILAEMTVIMATLLFVRQYLPYSHIFSII